MTHASSHPRAKQCKLCLTLVPNSALNTDYLLIQRRASLCILEKIIPILQRIISWREEPIQFVDEWKYLGLIISKGKCFSVIPNNDLRNFYASFNSLYNAHTRPSETVLMHLLYTTCIPNLTYAANVKQSCFADMSRCNTAVNDAIWKIFGFKRWESITAFRIGLG